MNLTGNISFNPGNNHLSYTLDPETQEVKILEENHYYPFGLKHNYNAAKKTVRYKEINPSKREVKQALPDEVKFKYLYNFKEYQDELSLNWYDYGARNYDPALGRWMNIDPLAERYYTLSTYVYAGNNPVRFVDVDGRYFDDKKSKRKAKRKQRREKRKMKRLVKKVGRYSKKGKDVTNLQGRINQLRKSIKDIDKMENDENVAYRYKKFNTKNAKKFNIKGPAAIPTGRNPKGHPVVTMFVENNMKSFIHESRHGGQYATIVNGRRLIDPVTTEGYGLWAEESAYLAQFSWRGILEFRTNNPNLIMKNIQNKTNLEDPSKVTIKNIKLITPTLIRSIVDPGLESIYTN